jgi:hypothetical protein
VYNHIDAIKRVNNECARIYGSQQLIEEYNYMFNKDKTRDKAKLWRLVFIDILIESKINK